MPPRGLGVLLAKFDEIGLALGACYEEVAAGVPRGDSATAEDQPPPEWKHVPPSGVRLEAFKPLAAGLVEVFCLCFEFALF